MLYLATIDGRIHAIDLVSRTVLFSTDLIDDFPQSPAILGSLALGPPNYLYALVADGRLFCVNTDTGDGLWLRSLGSFDNPGQGKIPNSPLIGDDGTIYTTTFDNNEGTLWAINPDNTIKWTVVQSGIQFFSPVYQSNPGGDGVIYVHRYTGDLTGSLSGYSESDGTFVKSGWLVPNEVGYSPSLRREWLAVSGTTLFSGGGDTAFGHGHPLTDLQLDRDDVEMYFVENEDNPPVIFGNSPFFFGWGGTSTRGWEFRPWDSGYRPEHDNHSHFYQTYRSLYMGQQGVRAFASPTGVLLDDTYQQKYIYIAHYNDLNILTPDGFWPPIPIGPAEPVDVSYEVFSISEFPNRQISSSPVIGTISGSPTLFVCTDDGNLYGMTEYDEQTHIVGGHCDLVSTLVSFPYETREPLENQEFILEGESWDGNRVDMTTHTDEFGNYQFDVPSGFYYLSPIYDTYPFWYETYIMREKQRVLVSVSDQMEINWDKNFWGYHYWEKNGGWPLPIIHGRINDSAGEHRNVYDTIVVSLDGSDEFGIPYSDEVTTSNYGYYAFTNVPEGTYTIVPGQASVQTEPLFIEYPEPPDYVFHWLSPRLDFVGNYSP